MLIQILWEYEVKEGGATQFEHSYSSSGEWAALFRRSPTYRGTVLMRDTENPGRYITTDSWDSVESFHSFREQFAAEYDHLDRAFEKLTDAERCLGVFEVM